MTYRRAHNFWDPILNSLKSEHFSYKTIPLYIGEYKVCKDYDDRAF